MKKDTVNKKPYRIVVDVQKKGVTPKPAYYGKRHLLLHILRKMYRLDPVNTQVAVVYLVKQSLSILVMVVATPVP